MDARAFYEHVCSREWMQASPEILQPARSLSPVTFCLGFPTEAVWDASLEPSLKAIRVNPAKMDERCILCGLKISYDNIIVRVHKWRRISTLITFRAVIISCN